LPDFNQSAARNKEFWNLEIQGSRTLCFGHPHTHQKSRTSQKTLQNATLSQNLGAAAISIIQNFFGIMAVFIDTLTVLPK
jgi:hypothetical protein